MAPLTFLVRRVRGTPPARARWPAWVALGAGLLATGALATTAVAAAPTGAPPRVSPGVATPAPSGKGAPDKPTSGDRPLFGDWIAHGSGCHAGQHEPGDVRLEVLEENARIGPGGGARSGKVSDRGRARFLLEHLILDAGSPAAGSVTTSPPPALEPDFAVGCSLRMALQPPPGKRPKRIAARTTYASTKDADVKLLLAADFRLGTTTLGQERRTYDYADVHRNREEAVQFEVDLHNVPRPAPFVCGKATTIAFDYTWVVMRPSSSPKVHVGMTGGRHLEVEVELEDCK